jgi:hypothetical protein
MYLKKFLIIVINLKGPIHTMTKNDSTQSIIVYGINNVLTLNIAMKSQYTEYSTIDS